MGLKSQILSVLLHSNVKRTGIGSHIRTLCSGQRLLQLADIKHAPLTTTSPEVRDSKECNRLKFIEPHCISPVPVHRVLDEHGTLVGDLDVDLTPQKITSLYLDMVALNVMDEIMFNSHRQGRISFYMTSFGEEAAQLGSAGALQPEDWIYAQYREPGILIHRKMPLKLMMAQCYGNKEDLGKGRQMPVHYGSRELNYVTISSPLATQMPQAAGTAYVFKRDKSGRVVACYFGEGASSEGDAHAALNFASTLDCPVIFFCRNNGYAISTPASEQFRSDGFVTKGVGYGMSAIRVDGNDLFAVYSATKAARQICAQESRPVIIEAMTYRVGHHSTSDDSLAYRDKDEIKGWQESNPIRRVYSYLIANGLWSEEQEKKNRAEMRAELIKAFNWAEKLKKLPIRSMFEDVYDELPAHIQRQRDELEDHLREFGENYPVSEHESS